MKSSITHEIDGEYIREWLIIGPFFPDSLDKDFLADAGGEANIIPKEGDTITTTDGRTLTWKRYESDNDVVNLIDAVGKLEHATAYAFCILQCETECDVSFGVSNDDGIRIWMNGKEVYSYPVLHELASYDEDEFGAELKPGNNSCLIKVSQRINIWGFALRIFPLDWGVISGTVMDEAVNPIPEAHVRLEQDGKEIVNRTTDASGGYRLTIYPAGGTYDLSVTSGNLGNWQLGIPLTAGERRKLNLTLKENISIEGTLLMLDDKTPHVAVIVQAVIPSPDGKGEPVVAEAALSDESGRYQIINLKPGKYEVRCCIPGEYLYYSKGVLEVEQGKTISNVNFRFPPIKKGTWRHYTSLQGLSAIAVNRICVDSDGFLWLGTDGGGAFRFDGKEFRSFDHEDGLPLNSVVWSIHQDTDGETWFGIWGGNGPYRYDGKKFVHFGEGVEGLGDTWNIFAINSDSSGSVWFGTGAGEVFRYDKTDDSPHITRFTTREGFIGGRIWSIRRASDGMMWFFTPGGGSRYDGRDTGEIPYFTNFTYRDALASHGSEFTDIRDRDGGIWYSVPGARAFRYDGKDCMEFTTNHIWPHRPFVDPSGVFLGIQSTPDGAVWLGNWGAGMSRYDRDGFVNFAIQDGLLSNVVKELYADPDGVIWIASGSGIRHSEQGGLSRYDPSGFISFDTRDGLSGSPISGLHISSDGTLWISTFGGGIHRYMGYSSHFKSFTTEDGLASNYITIIHEDNQGVLWFGSGHPYMQGGGVSRYDTRTGKVLKALTARDGLAHDTVYSIYAAPDGVIWFGTNSGVSRYDTGTGKFLETLTKQDGLADNLVVGIHCDRDGVMWFTSMPNQSGNLLNVTHYDGNEFVKVNPDGIMHLMRAFGDKDNVVWFLRWRIGLYGYDGKELVRFTQKDGLADNWVTAVWPGAQGLGVTAPGELAWFGTRSKGVSFYNGVAWSSLDTRDGLAGNGVNAIVQDADDYLWFGTWEGRLTRYRRTSSKPKAYITSVTTDQTYRDLSAIPPIVAGTRITIEYNSIDFKTIPEKRQYRVRIVKIPPGPPLANGGNAGSDSDWGKPTKETAFEWICHELGTYTFEVQAIDRDLNYSEPAALSLTIQADPRLVALQTEVEQLRHEVGEKYQFATIIGNSMSIREVKAIMEKAIDSDLTVLIMGETGTGKELMAKAIHHNSKRKEHPLLDMNCGAVPKELLASKLFGHRKGAFTGAYEDQIGLFEAASGGTLLLDEVGEMPQEAQIQLLRVLEERKIQRLGENISRDVDVRVIAMTNRDLLKEADSGRFREDLYYRLSVFPIHVPPLRERKDDIPILAEHFLKEIDDDSKGFGPDVIETLQSYSWPGNVRELRNAVHRAATLAPEGDYIQTYHFSVQITKSESLIQEIVSQDAGLSASVEQLQRRLVENALQECHGNRAHAAKMLRMDRPNLVRLMKRLGIKW